MTINMQMYAQTNENNTEIVRELDIIQNTVLYKILANIGNKFDIKSISDIRGFPKDTSQDILKEFCKSHKDINDCLTCGSYVTMREIYDYYINYTDGGRIIIDGWVDKRSVNLYGKSGNDKLNNTDLTRYSVGNIKPTKNYVDIFGYQHKYIHTKWITTAFQLFCENIEQNTSFSSADNIKLIFWFDSLPKHI